MATVSIKPITMYQAVCDGCEKHDETDDYSAWGDENQALEVATDGGWFYDVATDRLLCAECWAAVEMEEDE